MECRECRRAMSEGEDIVIVQHGVIGLRGFVPLGDTDVFCNEACVVAYYSNGHVEKLKRKIA